jgi:hypothetical protein
VLLPVFPTIQIASVNTSYLLAMVEMDVEQSIGSYSPKEHKACINVKLSNGGCLNRVFEHMGIAYALHLEPVTEAFVAATRKRRVDDFGKTIVKKAKVAPTKKVGVVKIIQLKPKPRVGHFPDEGCIKQTLYLSLHYFYLFF